MCNCGNCDGCKGILRGPQGPAGATGAAGSNGQYGGFSSRWLFSTTTSSNPSSTTLRLNNSSPASATLIYVNETNADSTSVQPFLNSFSNGGNFGLIRIFKEFNSAIFADYQVGLVTDSGSYFSIGVTYVSGSGSFAANDSVVLSFAANGANGTAGAAGQNGVAILDTLLYNEDAQTNTTGGAISMFGGTPSMIQIDSTKWMSANEDGLFYAMTIAATSNTAKIALALGLAINSVTNLGGAVKVSQFGVGNGLDGADTRRYYRIEGLITRVSATTFRASTKLFATAPAIPSASLSDFYISRFDTEVAGALCESIADISCPTFASNNYLIPYVNTANSGDYSLVSFTVWAGKRV